MIDLSITKDPDWIKHRENLWKVIAKDLKEGLRKKDLEKVHHYFMTGSLRDGETLTDAAAFGWFPIQTPDAWDYLFQYVIKDKKYYEYFFYFSFADLSHRALNLDEELAMWDYFAGNAFQPIVTSRVPVGMEGNHVSFEVDKGEVAAVFWCFVDDWANGKKLNNNYKMNSRINYLLTMLNHINDEECLQKDNNGNPASRAVYAIRGIFRSVCCPQFGVKQELDADSLRIRQEFFSGFRLKLDETPMPSAMKQLWEETKEKQRIM